MTTTETKHCYNVAVFYVRSIQNIFLTHHCAFFITCKLMLLGGFSASVTCVCVCVCCYFYFYSIILRLQNYVFKQLFLPEENTF